MKTNEQLDAAVKAIGADTCEQNDIYTDFTFYADKVDGMDWKAMFFFDSELSRWSEGPSYLVAASDGVSHFEETTLAPPAEFKARCDAAFAAAQAGAA